MMVVPAASAGAAPQAPEKVGILTDAPPTPKDR